MGSQSWQTHPHDSSRVHILGVGVTKILESGRPFAMTPGEDIGFHRNPGERTYVYGWLPKLWSLFGYPKY